MKYLIIISGAAFAIGNVIWPLFDEPKIFYIPLALFLLSMILFIENRVRENKVAGIFFKWLILLAWGNLIKQIFYTETIKQVNDYVWGGMVTAWLILQLIRNGRSRAKHME